MKILLVSNMYPSKKYPHYGVFVENTEKVLRRLPDVKISKAVLSKQDSRPGKLFGYLFLYMTILIMGIMGNYDVIYGHFISHISLPLRLVKKCNRKVRLILNAHGNDVIADSPQDDKWVALSHKLVPLADHIIVPSEYFKQVMCRDFGVTEDKILVYPSGGVDTQVFCPRDSGSLRQKYQLDPNKKYIGYISRIEEDKGWDTFLKAVAALSDRKDLGFIVVGSGRQDAQFQETAQQLGVTETLIRYPLLSQAQLAEIYNALDVFCFPTRRKSESLGLVGLEAISCGCLTVTSDAGGPASYMRDGVNGLVFDRNSETQLTEKLLQALSLTEQQLAALREGMEATRQQYCTENANKIILDFFKAL